MQIIKKIKITLKYKSLFVSFQASIKYFRLDAPQRKLNNIMTLKIVCRLTNLKLQQKKWLLRYPHYQLRHLHSKQKNSMCTRTGLSLQFLLVEFFHCISMNKKTINAQSFLFE